MAEQAIKTTTSQPLTPRQQAALYDAVNSYGEFPDSVIEEVCAKFRENLGLPPIATGGCPCGDVENCDLRWRIHLTCWVPRYNREVE